MEPNLNSSSNFRVIFALHKPHTCLYWHSRLFFQKLFNISPSFELPVFLEKQQIINSSSHTLLPCQPLYHNPYPLSSTSLAIAVSDQVTLPHRETRPSFTSGKSFFQARSQSCIDPVHRLTAGLDLKLADQ